MADVLLVELRVGNGLMAHLVILPEPPGRRRLLLLGEEVGIRPCHHLGVDVAVTS
jgi:hypothetical protein